MDNSFCQQITEAAESHPDKLAMKTIGVEGSEYTFRQMLDEIRNIAFRLEKEGIEFGDRVALIGENHPRWAICYFGILFRGAVCVPIDPHGEIETITNFFENSEAKMAFIGQEFIKEFKRIEENLGKKVPVVILQDEFFSGESPASKNGFQPFSDWAKTERPKDFDQRPLPAKPEDMAVLIYTSGTTGKPKGVPLTHGNIYYETNGCQEVMHISEDEVVLSVLPLFHVFAQVVNLWVIASIGGTICYVKELVPEELTKAFQTKEITLLTGVPRIWYLFHKKVIDGVKAQSIIVQTLFNAMLKTNFFLRNTFNINLGKKFFKKVHDGFGGKLDITISAGSRFDEKIARDYYALGFSMIQGYGLTETSGAVTATRFEDNVVGSVGKAVNYAEIKLGETNEKGEGEVLIKGKMVFGGYYKNPEATKETFTEDGWFKSGDLGTLNKDGHLFIVGRSKDVIALPNGKNIHPEDLETHYLKTPTVEEMAILGVTDEGARAGAEKLIAVVVPDFAYLKQKNVSNSKEAVRYDLDNLGRELPEYQRVREYIVTDEPLPRTSTKKIKRFELQKQIESGELSADRKLEKKVLQLTAEDTQLLESNVGKAVVSVLKKNSDTDDKIHPAQSLELDLGLDSLSRAEVFAALEQAFDTEFAGEDAAQALTVKDVIELTKSHAGNVDENSLISTEFNWAKIVLDKSEDLPEIRYVLRDRVVFPGIAYLVYKAFKIFNRFFMSLEVENEKVLEKIKRPFLICPNHQRFLDPFIITANYPFRIYKHIFHVGASQFFQSSFMQWVAQQLSVVPIDPDTQLMKAMKAGAIGLKNGKVLNIYPEGERAFDGELHDFKKGAAILATELDLPILPVAIDGVYKVWARQSWVIRPAKVKVKFGEPFYPKDVLETENGKRKTENVSDEQKYEIVTAHLKTEIEKMIDEMRK
ncbi:MAG: AMP-binding protein [Pyrinomonadaceae bacterium]